VWLSESKCYAVAANANTADALHDCIVYYASIP